MKFGLIPYQIYTDGSAKGSDYAHRAGGWSFIILYDGCVVAEGSGGENDTTNQRMELRAAIEGIKNARHLANNSKNAVFEIYSDSAYLVNCYIQHWYKGWQQFGWYNSKNEPVKNQDLWEELIPYFENLHYSFIKIKGHSKDQWNDRVDKLAQAAAEQARLAGKEI